MRSLAIQNFRRSELERWIDNAIDLLDTMDDDPDLECESAEDFGTKEWSGDGVAQALRMIATSPAASKRADAFADAPRTPLVYVFTGGWAND